MRIFKMSHGTNYIDVKNFNSLKSLNLITMGSGTLAKGQSKSTQFENFINADKGDLFFLCRSNETIELIGMFIDKRPMFSTLKELGDTWVDREYVTIAHSKNSKNFSKSMGKW